MSNEKLDGLTRLIENGFAALSADIGDLKTDVAELHAEMAGIHSSINAMDDRLHAVEQKLDGINRRLDGEAMQRQELKLPDRVKRIEQHLGMDRTISA